MHHHTSNQGEHRKRHQQAFETCELKNPVFYMLPKIQKTNNPVVVSSVNSYTQKISAYVDDYLRPLAERLPSYIHGTAEFIKRLWARNCLLVTSDVSSLYTNIDTDEGLTIVREQLEKSGQNNLLA